MHIAETIHTCTCTHGAGWLVACRRFPWRVNEFDETFLALELVKTSFFFLQFQTNRDQDNEPVYEIMNAITRPRISINLTN